MNMKDTKHKNYIGLFLGIFLGLVVGNLISHFIGNNMMLVKSIVVGSFTAICAYYGEKYFRN